MAAKDVRDVVPGDQIPFTRIVTQTQRTDGTLTLVFEDGSSQVFTLSMLPTVDVLEAGEVSAIVAAPVQ